MILKTTRWKNTNFGDLISYILSDKGRANTYETFTITHNLSSAPDDVASLAKEYLENDTFRRKIKKGVVMYHELLSFSPLDAPKITTEMLEEIAHKYISIRASEGICIAKPHISEDHPHIHFCWHGTLYKSAKTLRMDNQEFLRVRLAIEEFQLERFPQLQNSLVYINKLEQKRNIKNSRDSRAYALQKRTGKPLKKQELSIRLSNLLQKSQTLSKFYNLVEKAGFELYEQRGKVKGVKTNRKWRFTTLGIDLKALEIQREQLSEREQELRLLMSRNKDINKGLLR